MALSAGDGAADVSLGVRLLLDIHEAFVEAGADRLPSARLCDLLAAQEEAPWGEMRGKPITPHALAPLLKPYGIRPRTVRLPEGNTPRGYHREDFKDAWSRYTRDQTATPPRIRLSQSYGRTATDRSENPFVAENSHDAPTNECGVVADRNLEDGHRGFQGDALGGQAAYTSEDDKEAF